MLILGMCRVMAMDATGLNALEELHAKLRRRGRWLLLAGATIFFYLLQGVFLFFVVSSILQHLAFPLGSSFNSYTFILFLTLVL